MKISIDEIKENDKYLVLENNYLYIVKFLNKSESIWSIEYVLYKDYKTEFFIWKKSFFYTYSDRSFYSVAEESLIDIYIEELIK